MTMAQYSLSSLTEVVAKMALFATSCGWTASMDGTKAVIRRPLPDTAAGKPDADLVLADLVTWTVEPIIVAGDQAAGVRRQQKIKITSPSMGNDPTNTDSGGPYPDKVEVRSPYLNGKNFLPDIPNPTRLHGFGAGNDQPFLAFVIEYAFNQFRHIYLGSMDRIGAYKGGDCCAVTDFYAQGGAQSYPRSAWASVTTLFRGNIVQDDNDVRRGKAGGVYVGADMDGPVWRRCHDRSSPASPDVSLMPRQVFGGHGDSFDDLLIASGFADFSGEQLIFPIHLFTPHLTEADARFRPLGQVRGARHVNMKNLEPGALIQVGNRNWRVFPTVRKSELQNVPQGPEAGTGVGNDALGRAYAATDASMYSGVAYLVGDA